MKAIVLLFVALLAFQSVKAEQVKGSTTCDACEYAVGLVENYLNANYTVQEITGFLDKWCEIVPGLAQVCDQIVQYGVQDFIAYVDTNESPQTFCTQVKLCAPSVAATQSNCALCEYVIQVVETYVESNTTVNEFVGILDHYCSLIPGFSQVCDQLVQYGVDDLLAYIQADLTPSQVCTLAKLCTSDVVPAIPVVMAPEDANCQLCEWVVSFIESYVEDNATVQQIVQELDTMCDELGIGAVCDQIINMGIQQIINYINQDLSPAQVCTLIKMCTSETVPAAPAVMAPEQDNCALCKYVVTMLESWVENNSTVQEIIAQLDEYCDATGFGAVCDQLVQYGIDEIINYINADLTPTQVCTLAKLCTSGEPAPVLPLAPMDDCDTCKYVVTIIESYVENNASVQQIVNWLETACNVIPGVGPICDQIIQMGVQQLIAYIEADLTPTQVCTLAKICTSAPAAAPVVPLAPLDDCDTCKYVVTIMESFVESNATVQEIVNWLDNACSQIVGPICDQFIQMGVQQLIEYIEADLTPSQVCTLAKFCTSQVSVPAVPAVVAQKGQTDCEVCEYVVGVIESYVEDNYTIQEIEQELEQACNIIPGIGPICQEMIQMGIQQIVQYINANLTPQQICTLLKICTSQTVPAVVAPRDSLGCDICKTVVGQVEAWLENNSTINEIVNRIESLCTYVKGYEAFCDQVVVYGVHEFVVYIETNEQPDTVCAQLTLCSSPKKTCPKANMKL